MNARLVLAAILLQLACFLGTPLCAQSGYITFDNLGHSTSGGMIGVSSTAIDTEVVLNYVNSKDPSSFIYDSHSGNANLLFDINCSQTAVAAISGNFAVGAELNVSGKYQAFLYNVKTTSYTSLSMGAKTNTQATCVSSSNVAGTYQDSQPVIGSVPPATMHVNHGFIYYGSGQPTTLMYPSSLNTGISAISGTTVVGEYEDVNRVKHGFIYPGWNSLDLPSCTGSTATGISGKYVVGTSQFGKGNRHKPHTYLGFLYDGVSMTTLSYHDNLGTSTSTSTSTSASGISGSYIVGGYIEPAGGKHGYYYYNGQYFPINVPGSLNTTAIGVSGNAIVGVYEDQNFVYHGFLCYAPLVGFVQWEGQPGFFTSQQLSNPAISGPSATPQGDGIPNLLKYLFNINPAQPMAITDRAALPTVNIDKATTPGTPYLSLTYRQYSLTTGTTLNVQTSTDLKTWTTVTPDISSQVGTDAITGDPIMEVGVKTNGVPKLFIRLQMTMP